MAEQAICRATDCVKPAKNGGYCWAHYKRNRKYAPPCAGGTARGTLPRFVFEIAIPYAGDDCLLWPFSSKSGNGYAIFKYQGKMKEVHRLVCEVVHGPSPGPVYQASNACGKGHLGCVNPRHLSWKTRKENDRDKDRHGTLRKGEGVTSSKLTEDQVRQIRALRGAYKGYVLAEMFGVDKATICEIQLRKTWKWLD